MFTMDEKFSFTQTILTVELIFGNFVKVTKWNAQHKKARNVEKHVKPLR